MVTYFETINRVILNQKFTFKDSKGVTHQFNDYGFLLRKIVLNHRAFSTTFFNRKRRNHHPLLMNSFQEYQEPMLSNFLKTYLHKDIFQYGLVIFLTAKKIVNFYGLSFGKVCHAPDNFVVVSFHGCSVAQNEMYENGCINTFLHECLHALGAEHTNDEIDDVMRKNGQPKNQVI